MSKSAKEAGRMSDPTQATDMADMSGSERTDRSGKVYKTTTLVDTSTVSFADAVRNAVTRAQKTLRNVEWFEVLDERGRVEGEDIIFQVTLDIGFRLEG
jgi:flavin-binding protein dodecin